MQIHISTRTGWGKTQFKGALFIGRRSRQQSGKMLSSPPPRNTSENTSHVEQFLLKTNWRLTERLFYKQPCEERHTEVQQEGRRRKWLKTHGPSRGHRRGGLSLAQEPSLGKEGLMTHIGHLSPGVQHPEDECSQLWFENQWDLKESCKKPRLCL